MARELSTALREHGPGSVVHLGGGGSLGLSKKLVGQFFRSLGPITTLSGGVCGEAGEAAQAADFGEVACHDYTDLEHSRTSDRPPAPPATFRPRCGPSTTTAEAPSA